MTGEENRYNHHHHKSKNFWLRCSVFFYLEYYVGKNTMAVSILPKTINPDLDVRDVIVVHNFRFQVGLLNLTVKYCSTNG